MNKFLVLACGAALGIMIKKLWDAQAPGIKG